ncbi:putative membrane protein YwzB [Paenibacillus wynnii]|nr:putative membrane protein YwzB [Paenibacillus wynnii]
MMSKIKKVMDKAFVKLVMVIVYICFGYMLSNLIFSIRDLIKGIYRIVTGG